MRSAFMRSALRIQSWFRRQIRRPPNAPRNDIGRGLLIAGKAPLAVGRIHRSQRDRNPRKRKRFVIRAKRVLPLPECAQQGGKAVTIRPPPGDGINERRNGRAPAMFRLVDDKLDDIEFEIGRLKDQPAKTAATAGPGRHVLAGDPVPDLRQVLRL